jgi:hypothetical protein
MKKIVFCLAVLFIVFTACEDMFVKRINVEQADFPAKLSITATLDTDSGRLSLFIKEGNSLQSFHSYKNINQTIVCNGTICLYENDREIFTETGIFDLSTGSYGNKGYNATFTGISTVAGYTYRLAVEMEGYPAASAVAVMPEAPVVYGVDLDTEHTVEKKNVLDISPLRNRYSTISITGNPFVMNIADNSAEKDCYALRIDYSETRDYKNIDEDRSEEDFYLTMMTTPDLTLIQDNPDIESKDLTLSGESYNLYGFYLMLLTDATFSGSHKRLEMYLSSNEQPLDESRYYSKPVVHYNPWRHGDQTHLIRRRDLLVTHLSPDVFRQYRNMAFQIAGMDFFSEPVFITSNIENAYGCFSVQNTVRISVSAFEGWNYSGTVTGEDFVDNSGKGK